MLVILFFYTWPGTCVRQRVCHVTNGESMLSTAQATLHQSIQQHPSSIAILATMVQSWITRGLPFYLALACPLVATSDKWDILHVTKRSTEPGNWIACYIHNYTMINYTSIIATPKTTDKQSLVRCYYHSSAWLFHLLGCYFMQVHSLYATFRTRHVQVRPLVKLWTSRSFWDGRPGCWATAPTEPGSSTSPMRHLGAKILSRWFWRFVPKNSSVGNTDLSWSIMIYLLYIYI